MSANYLGVLVRIKGTQQNTKVHERRGCEYKILTMCRTVGKISMYYMYAIQIKCLREKNTAENRHLSVSGTSLVVKPL